MEELQARLAKDSHNNGKSPSSDGLKRKTKSLRKRNGRWPGGQLGHRGETLRLVATPEDVVEHRPPVCTRCQTSLDGASVALREARQVWDLPPLRLVVREHQALLATLATVFTGQPLYPDVLQFGTGEDR